MQFTSEEMKLVERLRKQERAWHWVRWMSLGLSVFTIACYGYISLLIYKQINWEALIANDAFVFALWWPKLLIATAMATWFLAWPLASWRGNATRLLLLKVLESHLQGSNGSPRH